METQTQLHYISALLKYKSPERYIARAGFIFDGMNLQGKRVLEIGCGKGALLAWAALHGASSVLGLEPEEDGAVNGGYRVLEKVISTLGMDSVSIRANKFDDCTFSELFDVVVLHNVINHLDEQAVVDLDVNPSSYSVFLGIVKKIRAVTAQGGVLILADAARSNLWGDLGARSPFAKTIEWTKHQNPATWQKLFEQAGFQFLDLRWSHLYPLGKWSSNFLLHYITISHFTMRFTAKDDPALTGGQRMEKEMQALRR